jgi:sugar O-acyltransferase (sialic acid O-acetyltransferase NeuD family)
MTRIVIYGGGGFAREVAWLAEQCGVEVACFADDNPVLHGQTLNDIPVMSLDDARRSFPDAAIAGGVGSPKARQTMMEKAAALGFASATLVHPRAEMSRRVEIGEGAVICAGNILTTNIKLGRHVQINLDCTVGHDVIMGDYATLAPGVHVSGCVHLGSRVYLGTGAVIINGTADQPLVIEDDAVVGAGACVTRSVPAGLTVVGVPAKPLSKV